MTNGDWQELLKLRCSLVDLPAMRTLVLRASLQR